MATRNQQKLYWTAAETLDNDARQIFTSPPAFSVACGSNVFIKPRKTQYFGLIDGELGVMSKVDLLGPRLASQDLRHMAAIASGMDLEQVLLRRHTKSKGGSTKAEAAAVEREGGGPVSLSPDINDATNSGPGNRNNFIDSQERLFTATKPPVTKPVERPEPPAWSSSRYGVLFEPTEGGTDSSMVPLLSASTRHEGSTTVSEGGSANVQVFDTRSCSTTISGGDLWGGSCKQQDEGENDSSSFASSFVSSSWLVSDEECSDTGQPSPSQSLLVNEAITTPKAAVLARARYRRRGRGRNRARGGGDGKNNATATAREVPRAEVSPRERRGRQITQQPHVFDDSNKSVSGRKPQPELYDIWIPQHVFQGKALPTPKRAREASDLQPPPVVGSKTQATVNNQSGGRAARTAAPNQGINPVSGNCHHSTRPQQQHKQLSAVRKRCTVHYVSGPEDFVKDDAAPLPVASTRAEEPSTNMTSTRANYSGRPTVFFAEEDTTGWNTRETGGKTDVAHLHDGNGDDQGRTAGGFLYDGARDGRTHVASDAAAAILDGITSTSGWLGEEEEKEEERDNEEEDEEYFDYAKRFSWQTAAEVVKEAEAEAEIRAIERRRQRRANGNENQDSVEASEVDVS